MGSGPRGRGRRRRGGVHRKASFETGSATSAMRRDRRCRATWPVRTSPVSSRVGNTAGCRLEMVVGRSRGARRGVEPYRRDGLRRRSCATLSRRGARGPLPTTTTRVGLARRDGSSTTVRNSTGRAGWALIPPWGATAPDADPEATEPTVRRRDVRGSDKATPSTETSGLLESRREATCGVG